MAQHLSQEIVHIAYEDIVILSHGDALTLQIAEKIFSVLKRYYKIVSLLLKAVLELCKIDDIDIQILFEIVVKYGDDRTIFRILLLIGDIQ
ncbi:hypothetical protein D1872_289560 [compost metagenome]